MKVLHVNHSDGGGGASRAALRLHLALQEDGINSSMLLRHVETDAAGLFGARSYFGKVANTLRSSVGRAIMRLQDSDSDTPRSGNFLPSKWANKITAIKPAVVNLHWIGAETMSIEDIADIRQPVVWTLHDMWAFCGTEHIERDSTRWSAGYVSANRSVRTSGLDLDRWVWERKKQAWRRAMRIIAPSQWMADCVGRSALMANAHIEVIPNLLNTELFVPLDSKECRFILGLPQDKILILFGAVRASSDFNKGYDLLLRALGHLAAADKEKAYECVVFGQSAPAQGIPAPMKIHWLGFIDSDVTLSRIYSAADVMVVPSRIENLPQTATEAQSCGCPVVAFRTCGLPDAVEDRVTGYLAEPYAPEDLSYGIRWLTRDSSNTGSIRDAARERATRLWSADAIVPKYVAQYHSAIDDAAAEGNI